MKALRISREARFAWLFLVAFLTACGGRAEREIPGAGAPDDDANADAPTDWKLICDFSDPGVFACGGLWMGPDIESLPDGKLPVEVSSLAPLKDQPALHLAGVASPEGADYMWHIAGRVEAIYAGARFWVRTELDGQELRVTPGSVEVNRYWQYQAEGKDWPAEKLTLTPEWQQIEVDFSDLRHDNGYGDGGGSSFMLGGLHFLIPPNAEYDFWIDTFELASR